MTINVNGNTIDVLTHYGTATPEQVKKKPEQVKQAGLLVTAGQDRAAQNSYQLAHFLRKSLTETAKIKVAVKEADYTTNGVTHGLSLLKAVIGAAFRIKNQISSLSQEILANDNNIVNFNAKANMLEQELLSMILSAPLLDDVATVLYFSIHRMKKLELTYALLIL